MKKIIFTVILSLIVSVGVFARPDSDIPRKLTYKQMKAMDKYLDDRLHFTNEQKQYIKENRSKNKHEMEAVINKMQKIHDEINEVYMLGLPRYQVYARTAPKKAQLVILKQNAQNLREAHRKSFEAILSDEQKIEFEKIREEFAKKRKN